MTGAQCQQVGQYTGRIIDSEIDADAVALSVLNMTCLVKFVKMAIGCGNGWRWGMISISPATGTQRCRESGQWTARQKPDAPLADVEPLHEPRSAPSMKFESAILKTNAGCRSGLTLETGACKVVSHHGTRITVKNPMPGKYLKLTFGH